MKVVHERFGGRISGFVRRTLIESTVHGFQKVPLLKPANDIQSHHPQIRY